MGSLPGACKKCARKAEPGSEYCCDACEKYGIHTVQCNKTTWPESRTAEYYDDPDAAVKILDRMQKTLALCHVVHEELRTITEAGDRFIPGFRTNAEYALTHLHYDILHCESIFRKLMKG